MLDCVCYSAVSPKRNFLLSYLQKHNYQHESQFGIKHFGILVSQFSYGATDRKN